MGGVVKTTKKGIEGTKTLLSGKGNYHDFFDSAGMPFLNSDKTAQPQVDPHDPFTFDPYQTQADQAAILGLGQSQDAENQKFITSDSAARAASRDQLAQLLTQQAQQSFSQTLPQTAEDYNAGHLLNSSGYGNEVARQQSNLAAQIANQVGMQGISDIGLQSQQRAAALAASQGYGNAALGRGLSLQDFTKQAQVAKAIGAQAAPQVGSGKGIGTGLAGAGTGATIGTQILPGWGTAIGAGAGFLAGYGRG